MPTWDFDLILNLNSDLNLSSSKYLHKLWWTIVPCLGRQMFTLEDGLYRSEVSS